jgi:hypothetical protein
MAPSLGSKLKKAVADAGLTKANVARVPKSLFEATVERAKAGGRIDHVASEADCEVLPPREMATASSAPRPAAPLQPRSDGRPARPERGRSLPARPEPAAGEHPSVDLGSARSDFR